MSSHTAALHAYRLLVFACIAGFAAYDLRTRRVPDRALLLFCPIALAAPFLNALVTCMAAKPFINWSQTGCMDMALAAAHARDTGTFLCRFLAELPPSLLSSLAGAATGFMVLFAAAMASPGGCGVGGGDIKLAAVMGFAFGPSQMITTLLISSGLAAIAALFVVLRSRHNSAKKKLSLPFIPFLAAGSLITTIAISL